MEYNIVNNVCIICNRNLNFILFVHFTKHAYSDFKTNVVSIRDQTSLKYTFQNRSTSFLLLSKKSAMVMFCVHFDAEIILLMDGPHPTSDHFRCSEANSEPDGEPNARCLN